MHHPANGLSGHLQNIPCKNCRTYIFLASQGMLSKTDGILAVKQILSNKNQIFFMCFVISNKNNSRKKYLLKAYKHQE